MTIVEYKKGLSAILSGVNFALNPIKAAILDSGYTPNVNTHEFFSDVSGNQVSGTGYTAGGATLNVTDIADGVIEADDLTWGALTVSNVKYIVFYRNTGTASTSELLFYYDIGTAVDFVAQPLEINFDNGVILKLVKN